MICSSRIGLCPIKSFFCGCSVFLHCRCLLSNGFKWDKIFPWCAHWLRKFIPYKDLNLPPSIYVILSTLFWFAQAHATFYIYLEESSSSARNSNNFISYCKIPTVAWDDILVKKCGMACAHSERGQRSCTNKGTCFAIHYESLLREQYKSNKSVPDTRVLFIWQPG